MKTKIKSDHLGLYVIAGGYISRPLFGTCFNEGDEVKTHSFPGVLNGVTTRNKPDTHHFKKNGMYELWCSTGLVSYEYKKGTYTKEQIEYKTEWYKNDTLIKSSFHIEHNKKFVK